MMLVMQHSYICQILGKATFYSTFPLLFWLGFFQLHVHTFNSGRCCLLGIIVAYTYTHNSDVFVYINILWVPYLICIFDRIVNCDLDRIVFRQNYT